MATEDEDLQELDEVGVHGVNRNPDARKRFERAPGHFAGGTLLLGEGEEK